MSARNQHSRPRSSFRFFGGRSNQGRGLVAASVAQLINRPEVTLARVVAAIEGDPVFARRVRNTAQERASGRIRIRSTRDAVSLMGFAALGRLAHEHARGAAGPRRRFA